MKARDASRGAWDAFADGVIRGFFLGALVVVALETLVRLFNPF